MKTIDINVARKIVELLSHGLVYGLGNPEPGQMCVEAVVCQALDLPHGDDPGCVMKSLRAFKIKINDLPWSSKEARAEGLKRLALIQLGSLEMNEVHFVTELAKLAQKWAKYAAKAEYAAEYAEYAAKYAAKAEYAEYAAEYAEYAAKYAAKYAAEYAAGAAEYAAEYAAKAAAYGAAYGAKAAYGAHYAAEYDKVLANCAEDVVQVLISMNAPGKQWLELAPCAE